MANVSRLSSIRFPGLYLITDHDHKTDEQLFDDIETVLAAGVPVIQYRDKSSDPEKRLRQAAELRRLTAAQNAMLIINDDIQLASRVKADGVHLGREDGRIAEARAQLGSHAIIGVSCYNDLSRAREANEQHASYIAFGRFFTSATKPDAAQADISLISGARHISNLPLVAIGGITPENAQPLLEAGIDLLAVIQAVFGQHDVRLATQNFMQLLDTYR